MTVHNLPALPQGNVWDVREFAGNEVQYYAPGERVELRVLREHSFLGFKFKIRDETYPVYLVSPQATEAYFREVAELIVQRHEAYVANRAATQRVTTQGN